ncbi:unnamed protein product [Nesidiocoris tenuis]|uniref:P-type domain-containing protein n=1 Tax=Nesidiocoris tenuis TaxID=355587 RepID=A0A6H5GG47_9HEMI|nr:unnamed protein product [Nesidiocoris tenuis]
MYRKIFGKPGFNCERGDNASVRSVRKSGGPSLRVSLYVWPIKYYHISRQWEAAHGSLIREYFFEGKHDNWIKKPPAYDFEAKLEKLPKPPLPLNDSCSAVKDLRFDCFPSGTVSEAGCRERGCCYQPATGSIPSCFYPQGYGSYVYKRLTINEKNISAELSANFVSPYPKQYTTIYLSIIFHNANMLQITVSFCLDLVLREI